MNEDLRTWFRQKWVRMDTKGEIKGPCAREDGEGKPKCLPAAKARSMSKQDRATAARRKRREDPVADRKGKGNKPIMVNTEEFIPEGNEPTNPALWSRAKALAKKKFDVYPSAYANGWAAKYYKSKGGGWRSVSEESVEEACWKGYKRVGMKKKGDRMVPNCVPEAREIIEKAKAKLKKDPLTGAKIAKDRFILPEEQDLEEGWGVKAHSFSSFKDGVQDWADNHTHNGKVNMQTRVVDAGGKKWHQTTASHKGVIVGTFNHAGNGKSEEGHGRHAHWSDNVHEELEEGWVVKKGTEVVSTHKTKDEADVKAMKHPLYKVYAKEEVELEEAYGMWKVDFPKQHAGKAVAAGSVHVKAQNSAHAHKVAAKRVGVDHKMFKSKVTKSSILPEELEEAENKQYIEITHQSGNRRRVPVHPLNAKRALKRYQDDPSTKSARFVDESKDDLPWEEDPKNPSRKVGERKDEYGNKVKNVAKHLAKKAMKANVKEELGKDNEWGRPELRKKFAAMTPGQEGLAADKIPTFDPRYDDVTTQHLGLHPVREGYLAEISARGAEARAKFQARVHKVLNDPAAIKRAKKTLAKKKAEDKAKEPAHLVMQLRKAVSIGSKVHFRDGSHHTIAPNHADRFMSKYNSAKSAIEKEALQKRAHASHSEFMKTIAEEVHENCGTPDCCMQCDTAAMGTHHVDSYEAHKGSGDQISPVISHDDDDIRFSNFDETEFEKELEADVLALGWEDLVDLYDDDELEYVEDYENDDEEDEEDEDEDEDEKEDMQEAITPAGRLKKKFNAMRTKTRRNMARNLALKRVSTPERVKARSIRAARRMVYKRLLRNRDISTVSAAEKTRLEAQVKRMAPMVARLSVRIMPKVRKLEQSRIQHARARKKK